MHELTPPKEAEEAEEAASNSPLLPNKSRSDTSNYQFPILIPSSLAGKPPTKRYRHPKPTMQALFLPAAPQLPHEWIGGLNPSRASDLFSASFFASFQPCVSAMPIKSHVEAQRTTIRTFPQTETCMQASPLFLLSRIEERNNPLSCRRGFPPLRVSKPKYFSNYSWPAYAPLFSS